MPDARLVMSRASAQQMGWRRQRKTDAEAWMRAQVESVARSSHISLRKSERPLSEVADAWRKTWGNLAPNTRLGYHYTLDKHVIGTAEQPGRFYRARVGDVTTETVSGLGQRSRQGARPERRRPDLQRPALGLPRRRPQQLPPSEPVRGRDDAGSNSEARRAPYGDPHARRGPEAL